MKQATAGVPETPFVPPPGVSLVRIDPLSGELATPACQETLEEAFYKGDEPTTPCPLHAPHDDTPEAARQPHPSEGIGLQTSDFGLRTAGGTRSLEPEARSLELR